VKTGIAFISGAVTALIAIPVAVVYVKPVRKGFTEGICKLASIGLKMAPYEEQMEFLNMVKNMTEGIDPK
jgi:hypothetical protein